MGKVTDGADEILRLFVEHVVKELEEASKCRLEIKQDQTKMKVEIGKLQVKAGIWGAIGGAIPVLMALIFWLLSKYS